MPSSCPVENCRSGNHCVSLISNTAHSADPEEYVSNNGNLGFRPLVDWKQVSLVCDSHSPKRPFLSLLQDSANLEDIELCS